METGSICRLWGLFSVKLLSAKLARSLEEAEGGHFSICLTLDLPTSSAISYSLHERLTGIPSSRTARTSIVQNCLAGMLTVCVCRVPLFAGGGGERRARMVVSPWRRL